MYVSKFVQKIPTEEIGVVIAAARGQASRKEGVTAGVYALGCGAMYLPDDGTNPQPGPNPIMGCVDETDEALAARLESHLQTHLQVGAAGDEVGAGGMWISILAPIVMQLLQRWLQPKPA